MIAGFLRQSCTWERRNGEDAWNKPVFGPPEDIPCRWVRKVTVFSGLMGPETTTATQAKALTEHHVREKDRLTFEGETFEVAVVSDIRGLDGALLGRKVYVK